MQRLFIAFAAFAALLPSTARAGGPGNGSIGCSYVLGFAALHAMIPIQVGACQDNEQHIPTNGDAVQQTTGGLLVWRRSDNWTAFTDGYHTWVNGPNGLQERLNSVRMPWEANPGGLPVVQGRSG